MGAVVGKDRKVEQEGSHKDVCMYFIEGRWAANLSSAGEPWEMGDKQNLLQNPPTALG